MKEAANPPPILQAAYRNAVQIQPRPLPWLWPNWIPSAALTLLVADPGVGKSLLSADLAARLSRTDTWPDASTNPAVYRWPPTIAFLASQDCAEDALLGRLIAASADLDRCRLIDGVSNQICFPPHQMPEPGEIKPLRLPVHLAALENILTGASNTRLMIIDPLTDVLECPSAPATETLFALTSLARRLNVAILATIHLNKSRAHRTLYRIRGSLDYIAVARSALLLSVDPNNPSRRFLHQIKNSYGPLSPPLTFTIAAPSIPQSPNPSIPVLSWDDPAANPALTPEILDLPTDQQSALLEACNWLQDQLADGPRPAREILNAANQSGITRMTLIRAKQIISARSHQSTVGQPWFWVLGRSPMPSEILPDAQTGGCQK